MPVTIGALRESAPGETRVSLVPEVADKLAAAGARVLLERGAGVSAQFPDALYKKVGVGRFGRRGAGAGRRAADGAAAHARDRSAS